MAILKDKPATADEAVRALTPMVRKLAWKFVRNHAGNDFDDVVQQGFLGLCHAYDRYDASKGSAFSSYAYQWIWALMIEDRKKAYKVMNNTSAKPIEDQNLGEYSMPMADIIDLQTKVEKMNPTERAVHRARQEGWNYRQIAEAMTSLGIPRTLHQVRRQHLAALEG